MAGIIIRDNESFERALKRFKSVCVKSGVISDHKKHLRYEKPSDKKRRKRNASIRKRMRHLRMLENN